MNIASYIKYPKDPSYVIDSVISNVKDELIRNRKAIIYGLPGVGKTSLATELAHELNEFSIQWFDCDDQTKADSALHHLIAALNLNAQQIDSKTLAINKINRELAKKPQDFLFIFDNVEKWSHLAEMVNNFPRNVHVLITTRDQNLHESIATFHIKMFKTDKAREFLKASVKNRTLTNDSINEILSFMSSDTDSILPIDLKCIVSLINESDLDTTDLLFKNGTPRDFMQIVHQKLTSRPKALDLLQFIAYMDADFIQPKLLSSFLEQSVKEITELAEELEKLSLIKIVANQRGIYGICTHRLLQDRVQASVEPSGEARIVGIQFGYFDQLFNRLNEAQFWADESHNSLISSMLIMLERRRLIGDKGKLAAFELKLASLRSNFLFSRKLYGKIKLLELDLKRKEDPGSLAVADVYFQLGSYFYLDESIDDLLGALVAFECCVSILVRHLGEMHEIVADMYSEIGECLFKMNEMSSAIGFYKKSFDINLSLKRMVPARLRSAEIARSFEEMGQLERAIEWFETYYSLYEDEQSLVLYDELVECLMRVGRYQEALFYLRKRLRNEIGDDLDTDETRDLIEQCLRALEFGGITVDNRRVKIDSDTVNAMCNLSTQDDNLGICFSFLREYGF